MSKNQTTLPPLPPKLDEGLASIIAKLGERGEIIIKTPTEPILASFILSRILGNPNCPAGPLLFVAPDDFSQLKIFQLTLLWLKKSGLMVAESAGQGVFKHRSQARWIFAHTHPWALFTCLQTQTSLFILSPDDVNAPLPALRAFKQTIQRLKAGDKITKEYLLKHLITAGYGRERTAAAAGLVASRGNLVDVWPTGYDEPIRLDWDGDTIESIKTFSPTDGAASPVKSAVIVPIKFHPDDDRPAKLALYLKAGQTIKLDPFPARADVSLAWPRDLISALYREAAPAKAKTSRKDFSFLKRLQTGDWVVHTDHGVAVFDGIAEQTVDGITSEYFRLLYAEGDKLFVPVTLAEKIEKYIGDVKPGLSRLSGGAWQKAVEKVRVDTLQEARTLLATAARRTLSIAPHVPRDPKIESNLGASFTYEETADQARAITAIYDDLARSQPMDRLICGDVGFGKTEVAIRAAAKAALAGFQVAVLSPTTILTQQHLDTFQDRLKDLPIIINGLSRFASAKEQKQVLSSLAAGSTDIVIGTHRLLSADVAFKNLGLIIIDEEQRFGVAHKEMLKKLRETAHVLTLTATPIPRTLHLALSHVRDISTITTAPAGRLPIATHIEPHNQTKIKEVLAEEIKRNGQAYYLYNNVETIALKQAELEGLLPRARFGILHGQLPEAEVADVMHRFDKGEIDVLVCSTIIENGLDLPNVNTLVVDNAVQFGLAQLHQIRGRIGRGNRQAYAYFFYKRQKLTGEAEKRLHALEGARELGAGFDLAMRDMEIRGVGNVLGKAQHGHVATVGLGLYLRLLREAVEEIKSGEPVEIMPDISVDLPIEARIPQFFEPNKEKRIELYHEWALITDLEDLKAAEHDLEKDGALPKVLQNFFYILRLKLLGKDAGLTAIDTATGFGATPTQSIILIPKEPIAPAKFAKMLDIAPLWHYATDELKINRADLGSDWMKKLEDSVRALTDNKK